MPEKERKGVKDSILDQIALMNEEELRKVLDFLSELAKEKQREQGVN